MLLGDATTLQTAILGALKLDLTCCYTTSYRLYFNVDAYYTYVYDSIIIKINIIH